MAPVPLAVAPKRRKRKLPVSTRVVMLTTEGRTASTTSATEGSVAAMGRGNRVAGSPTTVVSCAEAAAEMASVDVEGGSSRGSPPHATARASRNTLPIAA